MYSSMETQRNRFRCDVGRLPEPRRTSHLDLVAHGSWRDVVGFPLEEEAPPNLARPLS
jgi:hypothetical protein